MRTPRYQQALYLIVVALTILIAVGSLLQAFDVAISWISPLVTYIGSVLVIVAWGSAKFILRKWTVLWSEGGVMVRYRKYKPLESFLFAALIFLWYPRLASLLEPSVEIPEVSASISNITAPYAPGVEIEGVKWKPDFGEYLLKVWNKSANTEIIDLRVDIEIPGGVITRRIISHPGAESVTLSQTDTIIFGSTNVEGLIIQNAKIYLNMLNINAVKFFPDGFIEIKMILEIDPDWPLPGFFKVGMVI